MEADAMSARKRCVLQCQRVGVVIFPAPRHLYIYTSVPGSAEKSWSRSKYCTTHTSLVYMNPTFIFHKKKKVIFFLPWSD